MAVRSKKLTPSSSPPFDLRTHVNFHGSSIWTDRHDRTVLWPHEAVLLSVATYNNTKEPDVLLLNTLGRILSLLPDEVALEPRLEQIPRAFSGTHDLRNLEEWDEEIGIRPSFGHRSQQFVYARKQQPADRHRLRVKFTGLDCFLGKGTYYQLSSTPRSLDRHADPKMIKDALEAFYCDSCTERFRAAHETCMRIFKGSDHLQSKTVEAMVKWFEYHHPKVAKILFQVYKASWNTYNRFTPDHRHCNFILGFSGNIPVLRFMKECFPICHPDSIMHGDVDADPRFGTMQSYYKANARGLGAGSARTLLAGLARSRYLRVIQSHLQSFLTGERCFKDQHQPHSRYTVDNILEEERGKAVPGAVNGEYVYWGHLWSAIEESGDFRFAVRQNVGSEPLELSDNVRHTYLRKMIGLGAPKEALLEFTETFPLADVLKFWDIVQECVNGPCEKGLDHFVEVIQLLTLNEIIEEGGVCCSKWCRDKEGNLRLLSETTVSDASVPTMEEFHALVSSKYPELVAAAKEEEEKEEALLLLDLFTLVMKVKDADFKAHEIVRRCRADWLDKNGITEFETKQAFLSSIIPRDFKGNFVPGLDSHYFAELLRFNPGPLATPSDLQLEVAKYLKALPQEARRRDLFLSLFAPQVLEDPGLMGNFLDSEIGEMFDLAEGTNSAGQTLHQFLLGKAADEATTSSSQRYQESADLLEKYLESRVMPIVESEEGMLFPF